MSAPAVTAVPACPFCGNNCGAIRPTYCMAGDTDVLLVKRIEALELRVALLERRAGGYSDMPEGYTTTNLVLENPEIA